MTIPTVRSTVAIRHGPSSSWTSRMIPTHVIVFHNIHYFLKNSLISRKKLKNQNDFIIFVPTENSQFSEISLGICVFFFSVHIGLNKAKYSKKTPIFCFFRIQNQLKVTTNLIEHHFLRHTNKEFSHQNLSQIFTSITIFMKSNFLTVKLFKLCL